MWTLEVVAIKKHVKAVIITKFYLYLLLKTLMKAEKD